LTDAFVDGWHLYFYSLISTRSLHRCRRSKPSWTHKW